MTSLPFIVAPIFISHIIWMLIGLLKFQHEVLSLWLCFFGHNFVCWTTKKQTIVSQSSIESNYHALTHVVANVRQFCYILHELEFLFTQLVFYFLTISLLSTWTPILCFMLTLDISTSIYTSFVSLLVVGLFDSNMFLLFLNLQIYLTNSCLTNVFFPCISNCSFVSFNYNCEGVLYKLQSIVIFLFYFCRIAIPFQIVLIASLTPLLYRP